VRRLLAIPSVVPISPILVTLMKQALSSHKTPFLTRATRRNNSEDTILFSVTVSLLENTHRKVKCLLVFFFSPLVDLISPT
jgi:hypothetical protein